MRHTFASLLIAAGASVVFVASQMGHAKPTVTLDVYAHLFDARDHADKLAAILEANFAATLERPAAGDAIALHRDRAANSRFQIRYQTETRRTSGFAGQNAETPP